MLTIPIAGSDKTKIPAKKKCAEEAQQNKDELRDFVGHRAEC